MFVSALLLFLSLINTCHQCGQKDEITACVSVPNADTGGWVWRAEEGIYIRLS